MKKITIKKLHENTLKIVEDGIYLEIYQKNVQIIDKNIDEACSKMIPLNKFLQQLEGLNLVYPDLICTTYDINLVKPNYNAKIGGPYNHNYCGISNQYEYFSKPCSFNYLIDGVKHTIDLLNKKDPSNYSYYLVQKCRILCMFKKNSLKSKNKKRGRISKSIRHEVFKRDNYKCVECGASKENIGLHIDHILPISQGGSDELDNLQTLCETCNIAKSNRKWKTNIKV